MTAANPLLQDFDLPPYSQIKPEHVEPAVEQILAVNAAPGYSEHHGGYALDIGTPGEPPAEESFEATDAFAWLARHAPAHGFAMSYPRDNLHGIVYEPWHWRFVETP